MLAFWMFQVVFCATAATIVSGAMAERTKFSGYLIYSAVLSAIIYPVFGSWAWGSLFNGEGWLEGLGFHRFCGLHRCSLGWRMGRSGRHHRARSPHGQIYKDGQIKPILGHNMPLAALGVFILWLGWFGFNPGSTTAANKDIAMIFVNTNLAAAAGAVLAMITSWIQIRQTGGRHELNGALAGLVAITSPCASVSPLSAVIIGAAAGIIVVLSVLFFDKIKWMIRSAPYRFTASAAPGVHWQPAFSTSAEPHQDYRGSASRHRGLLPVGISDRISDVQTD